MMKKSHVSTECINKQRKERSESVIDRSCFNLERLETSEMRLDLNQTFPNSFSTYSKLKNQSSKLKNLGTSSYRFLRRMSSTKSRIENPNKDEYVDINANQLDMIDQELEKKQKLTKKVSLVNMFKRFFSNDSSPDGQQSQNQTLLDNHQRQLSTNLSMDHFRVINSDETIDIASGEMLESFRIILVGFHKVGKTSIASYLFPESDPSKDIKGRLVVDGRPCELELWHRTAWITSDDYPIEWQRDVIKKGDAFFIVISLELWIEISAIQFYIAEIKRTKGHNFPVFLVYNKSDLWSNRDQDGSEVQLAMKLAESCKVPFINTVAVKGNGKNIERLFYHTIRYIRHNMMTGRPYPCNEIMNKSEYKLIDQ